MRTFSFKGQSAHTIFLIGLAFATLLASTACLRKPDVPFSKTDSVDIPQTSIKNQYAAGFCWSYATIALIESNHLIRTGSEIDISEEALGYVRMRHELSSVARKYRAGSMPMEEITQWLDGRSLEGWFVRSPDSSPTLDSMELIDRYGLVPEKSWSIKFHSRGELNSLKKSISKSFMNFITSSIDISDETLDTVMTVDGAFHSPPPQFFLHEGEQYTPQSFAKNYLVFQSKDYVLLSAKNAADSRSIIMAVKKAMAAGYSIPLSFGVSMKNLKSGFFSARDVTIEDLDGNRDTISDLVSISGGHAVIATDFVNIGGQEGAIPDEDLRREVAKPAEQLAYLKLKNSWGANSSATENGDVVQSSQDGYYRMDYGYIKAVAAKGKFGAVVPRKFAP